MMLLLIILVPFYNKIMVKITFIRVIIQQSFKLQVEMLTAVPFQGIEANLA